jgi:quercetin dioxygenase-like cupin family protein
VLSARNADVKAIRVTAVEGKPTYGGELAVKPLIKGDEMTFLEIRYAPGVGAPLHTHTHESIAYVVKGKVKSTVGEDVFVMGPGDVCRHPKGALHGAGGDRGIHRRRDQVAGPGYRDLLCHAPAELTAGRACTLTPARVARPSLPMLVAAGLICRALARGASPAYAMEDGASRNAGA